MQIRHLLLLAFLIYACHTISTSGDSTSNNTLFEKSYADNRSYLVKEAQKLVGSKYRYGGTTPKGFDCSGFTSYIYQKIGITLPRSSSAQAVKGKKIKPDAAQPGDLLFFNLKKRGKIAHVAMVVANGNNGLEVVHSTTSRGVIREKISGSEYWEKKVLYGRNYID